MGAIALFALNSHQWIAAAVLVLLWLAALTKLRISADHMLQLALGLIAGGVAWLLSTAAALPVDARTIDVLGPIGQLVSLALLLAAALRLMFVEAWGGVRATAALVLLALLFLADGQFDLSFIAISVAVLVLLWRALWSHDPSRTAWRAMDGRLRVQTLAACAIAGAIATTTSLAIPAIYPWLSRIVLNAIDNQHVATGFSTTLTLGSLSDLRDNDARVLRVHGKYVEHLRGIAYDEYRRGRWVQSTEAPPRATTLARDTADTTTEIETVGGDARRYFVPLDAASLTIEGDTVGVDDAGNLYATPEKPASLARFNTGRRDRVVPAPPRERELQIPDAIAASIHEIATRWTASAQGSAGRVAALADHLRRQYRYSLDFDRDKNLDPVVDFLTVHREGHCEYFASALALLARSLGIPARVIGGYRVAEYNGLGDYYVVREQHAHAWVEVWQAESGWQTVDATPASALPSQHTRTPLLAGLFDAAGHLVSSLKRHITTRGLYAAAGALLAGWLLMRLVRWVRGRKASDADRTREHAIAPALARLLHVLERRGHPRDDDEPLERYATRLAAAPPTIGSAAALRHYSAYRYGGHGAAQTVERELLRAAESIASDATQA